MYEIGKNTPMTIQDFSKIMGKSAKKMEKIFEELLKFEMIVKDGEIFRIKNWDKYQSIEKYQEQNRIRQQKYREKLKSENEKNNVTVTSCNSTEEKIIEKNKEEKEEDNDFREYKI